MARRERYTERNRPHRKEVTRHQEVARPPDGLNNPIVLIAVGGLALAVFLALGVMFGGRLNRSGGAATPATTSEAADSITDTAAITDTLGADEPAVITDTTRITDTTGVTGTAALTDTLLSLPGSGTPYAAPDDMQLAIGKKAYFATIETVTGTIRAELWPEIAPAHVNSFVFLASKGFFDGLTFHRVEDWVVQGGDPTGKGDGGPGYTLPAEFSAGEPVPHSYGTLAMARTADPNSGGSQFYFIKSPQGAAHLDGDYTVFGHVVTGMDVVARLAAGDKMLKVTVEEKDIADREVSPDDIRTGKLPEPPSAVAP